MLADESQGQDCEYKADKLALRIFIFAEAIYAEGLERGIYPTEPNGPPPPTPSPGERAMIESLEYVQQNRGMPWVRAGMRIEVDGKAGVIKGGMGGNLAVLFDGEKTTSNAHPGWRTKYFDHHGNVIAIDGKLI